MVTTLVAGLPCVLKPEMHLNANIDTDTVRCTDGNEYYLYRCSVCGMQHLHPTPRRPYWAVPAPRTKISIQEMCDQECSLTGLVTCTNCSAQSPLDNWHTMLVESADCRVLLCIDDHCVVICPKCRYALVDDGNMQILFEYREKPIV